VSRSDWFGDPPSSWRAAPLGYYFDVVLGKMLNGSKHSGGEAAAPYLAAGSIQPGHLVLDETKMMAFTEAELSQYELRKGDIVVVEGGAGYGRSHLLIKDMPGWGFQNHVARLRERGLVRPAFLLYCLKACLASGFIEANNRTATLPSLSRDVLRALPIPVPTMPEQQDIANYLDRETARIDTLIAEQQRLIEMLRERRQTQIDHAVWSGLDGAPRTPTLVEPAPDVPAHWRVLRNKNLLSESTTVSADGSEELLSVSHLTGITPRSEKNVTMTEAETLDGYRLVEPGDLVINTMWAWMGALGVSRVEGIVSPAYGVYRPLQGAKFHPPYFDYLYRSRPYVVEMTRFSRGIWSSRLRIYPEVFLRLHVVVPPLDEQRRIAAYLDEQNAKIDTLIAETERFIELARERRSALITAAVTGQIDVRKVA
jgi:type I restriction enzyme S subunit